MNPVYILQKPGEDSDDDEDKYTEDVDMPGQKFVTKERITVRNLRIREDTAKVCMAGHPNFEAILISV